MMCPATMKAWHGMRCPGMTYACVAMAWHGMACHGMAWHDDEGMSWHGMAWQCRWHAVATFFMLRPCSDTSDAVVMLCRPCSGKGDSYRMPGKPWRHAGNLPGQPWLAKEVRQALAISFHAPWSASNHQRI